MNFPFDLSIRWAGLPRRWPISTARSRRPGCRAQLSSNPQAIINKGITMTEHLTHVDRPAGAWISFSYISFGASLLMAGGGIFALPKPARHPPSL